MTDGPDSLDDLRGEIDRLDAAMHDLLMKRAGVVRQMAGAKGAAPSMRPAREMEILRSLAVRHTGEMPLASVVHIWREIMAASLALQRDFKVYLPGGEDAHGLWDLARFHFGAATKLVPLGTAAEVINTLKDGDIGVLPAPTLEDNAPWWPRLFSAEANGPQVIARLPLIEGAPGYDFPRAFALANLTQRPTGDDATLVVALVESDADEANLAALLGGHGMSAQLLGTAPDDGGRRFMLFETDTFIAGDDPRLGEITKPASGIVDLKVVGGYARPIDIAASTGASA